MRKQDWDLDVKGRLKSCSLRGGEGVRKRGRECECSRVDNFCTASDSVASWTTRDSTAGVAVEADTVATVGVCALAAIIVSSFRASCSNEASNTSRICWISVGSHLRKRECMMSGGKVMPVWVRRR